MQVELGAERASNIEELVHINIRKEHQKTYHQVYAWGALTVADANRHKKEAG